MAKQQLSQEFKLDTRSEFTQVDCVITVSIDGRELPSLNIMGNAVDAAIATVREAVKESYAQVPARV